MELVLFMADNLTTAHSNWEVAWQTETGREAWIRPDPDVAEKIYFLKKNSCARVLDLGCGVGRHSIMFAENGFEVTSIDLSESGIEFLNKVAKLNKYEIKTEISDMDSIKHPDQSFDYVLAFNSIYLGDINTIRRTLAEIYRVLIPGGYFHATFLSQRNSNYKVGTKVAYNTFIQNKKTKNIGDLEHPHFYCNAQELVSILNGFEIHTLFDREHKEPGSYHFHVLAEKLK